MCSNANATHAQKYGGAKQMFTMMHNDLQAIGMNVQFSNDGLKCELKLCTLMKSKEQPFYRNEQNKKISTQVATRAVTATA